MSPQYPPCKISSAKPEDQLECCDFCETYLDCPILSLIRGNDESSATESMSDSDSSVASAGALDDCLIFNLHCRSMNTVGMYFSSIISGIHPEYF